MPVFSSKAKTPEYVPKFLCLHFSVLGPSIQRDTYKSSEMRSYPHKDFVSHKPGKKEILFTRVLLYGLNNPAPANIKAKLLEFLQLFFQ